MSTQHETQADFMRRVSKRVFDEVLNGDNIDVIDELYAPNCTWRGPGGRVIQGVDGLKAMISGYKTAFPDLNMVAELDVAEGNLLATAWRVTGTHLGPLGDLPPTGKEINMTGQIFARFEGGKVVEEIEVFDELLMLQQLGLAE